MDPNSCIGRKFLHFEKKTTMCLKPEKDPPNTIVILGTKLKIFGHPQTSRDLKKNLLWQTN